MSARAVRKISESELRRQRECAARVREINGGRAAPALAYVETYGCQQNEADSEKLRGMLLDMGYRLTTDGGDADVIVVNTCAIRDHAEKRALGKIGALKRVKTARPECILAVCGCMPQRGAVSETLRRSYGYVDLVFGVHALWRFPELLESALRRSGRVFAVDVDGDGAAIAEGIPSSRAGGVKAWLPIMYGCDNFCAYCVVPYVRGRERSREPGAVLSEARELAASGYRDITLLGQNVNSYGSGGGIGFPELLRRVNGIEGEFIIRFMTSHPKDAGDGLFCAMAECEKAARHIHLPFQAGGDRVLRAMNRGYTGSGYLALVDAARRRMPDIVITSDVIVGFPGERREDFDRTLELVKTARFDALFTFIYSPREGTPAASMDDPVPGPEKQAWFGELLAVQNAISAEKHAAHVGGTMRVLVDGRDNGGGGDGRPVFTARTNGGRLVRVTGGGIGGGDIGRFIDVKITGSTAWSLTGEKKELQ
ncbi:MAG: tRNA (N6-isopentenyl adenosine(37)-C2)-methylthiotransferase MiaB [Oscillospiraceae bacterium]|jgi:tRNA-2-methylthio-N6-dimethylallyladenosine synthase|nr:tRNA (N6-isopentenyl adenosine(37)-C2)-methylthiotransferase MiaB [Oscillospiraceae bacterium]